MIQGSAKPVWKSVTIHANLVVAAAAELVPGLSQWIQSHPHAAVLATAALNVALRHFTKGPIKYAPLRKTSAGTSCN